MKTPVLFSLLTLIGINVMAQKADTSATKPKRAVIDNPNSRRNGYETYQNSAELTGVGLAPGAAINTIDHRYEGLRGTPYFLPEWNKGQIEMTAGQNYKDVPIKFDAFRQQLMLLRTWMGNDSIMVNPETVKSFQFRDANGQTYLFRRLTAPQESQPQGYFLVLYSGKTALLKRIEKKFKPADYKDPYSNNTRYDQFRETDTYFLQKPDQTLAKIKLSDKALLEAIGAHQDELKAFAKQASLNLKTEEGAASLLKQYDNL
ncbi:hypothetical protein IC229_30010 [Spirosoma sp. BT702]|uniref:Uncharacterized protein n=1 Tax=Spirosoma profusum TaxID=2771354 RepID=A0A927GA93_9BACT|nr:hypothetical protein [Spirosoma profusum]MBD2704905.1 hypothetical protein [Spirosoma profusum]